MEPAALEVPRVEKKGKGRMVGILVALVLILSAGAAGAVFAPRILAKAHSAEKAAPPEDETEEQAGENAEDEQNAAEAPEPDTPRPDGHRAGVVGEIVDMNPLVVDSRAQDGSLRHVKVQLAIELARTQKGEEFRKFLPFAREASIGYLRTQEFDRLADPKSFAQIRKELEAEVMNAVGKKRVRRVLVVDFVVQ